jgi:hypothetical protein
LDLIEPGTTNTLSDEIFTDGHVLFLASDPLTDPTCNLCLTETGGWQDIGTFFGLPEGTTFVFSDVEATPEPTTFTLLGSGLLGLVMMRRRKLSRTASALA